jgi:L-gulono-1,4-lactone dehydrogenase
MMDLKYEVRSTWRNHTKNQSTQPLRIYDAASQEGLQRIVVEAEAQRATVRAVGSGHSWSDVALTDGFLVKTEKLKAMLDLERDLLDEDADSHLVRVEAGIKLRTLNRQLEKRGLALPNMGGYDAQSLAGVMATSTHGSGIRFGPIADAVRSIDLVASEGRLIRVEPNHRAITDPQAFRAARPDWQLVQDDSWFDAVRVGMGCMGLVYSVYLEVEKSYWLKEVRRKCTWEEVKGELASGELDRHRHYEVLFSPYPERDGELLCMRTTRDLTEPSGHWWGDPRRRRNTIPEFLAMFPWGVSNAINLLLDFRPQLAPFFLRRALAALADEEFSSVSYRVLNIGVTNHMPAYSSEIGVPIDGRELHIAAVERVIAVAERFRTVGQIYQTSPISLRFVKASTAHMSMMQGTPTMMIELIQMSRTEGGFELLAAYEEALYELCGRPHWGQVNRITGSHNLIGTMYPRYDDWLRVEGEINRSRVFDSPFSQRIGISTATFCPETALE